MQSEVQTLASLDPGVGEEVQGILTRARAGDADAFLALFNLYSRRIFGFIYGVLGDCACAEELTQETFVRAYQRLHKLRLETRLSTWLFGIAHNVAREAIKRKYRDRRKEALDEPLARTLVDGRSSPEERFFAREINAAIRKSLTALGEDHRLAFVLKILCGMRYQEISEITGSSVAKIKTDLHRARLEMGKSITTCLGVRRAGRQGGM